MMEEAIHYHRVLQNMNMKEKLDLIRSLVRSGGKENLSLLTDLLSDPVYEFRRAAFEALCQYREEILDEVVHLVSCGTSDQKYWAVQLLSRMDERAAGGLEISLKEGDDTICQVALDALCKFRQTTSVRPIMNLFSQASWPVRQKAFQILCDWGSEIAPLIRTYLDSENEDHVYWAIRLLGKMDFKDRKVLFSVLSKVSPQMKFVVASALGESGDPKVLSMLIKCFQEDSWLHAKRASDALIQIGKPAVKPLCDELSQIRSESVYWYLRTLLKMGSFALESLCTTLFQRPEIFLWNIREEMLKCREDLLPLLSEMIRSEDKSRRLYAYQILSDLEDLRCVDLLLEGLKDPYWVCKKLCSQSLCEFKESILSRIEIRLTQADADEMYWLIQVLSKIPGGGVLLGECLRREDKEIASLSAKALRGRVEVETLVDLVHCLQSRHWLVRREAAETIASAGSIGLEMVVKAMKTEDSETRYWLSWILKKYEKRVWPYLVTLLYREDFPNDLAALAIGLIQDSYFIMPLWESLKQGDDKLVLMASWAISKIQPDCELKSVFGLLTKISARREPILEELILLQKDSSKEFVLQGVESADPLWVENGIYLCGVMKLKEGLNALSSHLKGKDEKKALMAADAILEIGSEESISILNAVLEGEISDRLRLKLLSVMGTLSEEDVILHILSILKDSGKERFESFVKEILAMGPSVIPRLIENLSHSDVAIRKVCAEVLLEFGGLAVSALKKAQQGKDPNLRFWAGKILKMIHRD